MKSVSKTVKKQLNEAISPELKAFLKKGEIQCKAPYLKPGEGGITKLTPKELEDFKKIGAFLEKLGYRFDPYLTGHVDAQMKNRNGGFYLDHYGDNRNNLYIALNRM